MTENERPTILRRPATWGAANGHRMSGDEISMDGGKTWRTEGWSAYHSSTCPCVEGFNSEEYAGEAEFEDEGPDPFEFIDENFPI